jgi:hypothetical protein
MQNSKPLRGKGLHSRSNPRETGPEAFILSILRAISAVAFSTSERVRQYTILPLNAICWCLAFTIPIPHQRGTGFGCQFRKKINTDKLNLTAEKLLKSTNQPIHMDPSAVSNEPSPNREQEKQSDRQSCHLTKAGGFSSKS